MAKSKKIATEDILIYYVKKINEAVKKAYEAQKKSNSFSGVPTRLPKKEEKNTKDTLSSTKTALTLPKRR